jgi:hypothetical protein
MRVQDKTINGILDAISSKNYRIMDKKGLKRSKTILITNVFDLRHEKMKHEIMKQVKYEAMVEDERCKD